VPVLWTDLELLEEIIRRSPANPLPWVEFPQCLATLRGAIGVIERAADGETKPEEERQFRETWMLCKEAAVMDQDFEIAVHFRDTQDILVRVDLDFPRRPPHHVRAARVLSRGSLTGHSSLHANRAPEQQSAIEAQRVRYSHYLTDVFGPAPAVTFSSDWRTDTAVALARVMYESREFSAMPILGDALQDAGCDSDAILSHCRDPKQVHVRGCWVVDLVLGKE
jgi:hypothetical protein